MVGTAFNGWSEVGIVIRAVRGDREPWVKQLLGQIDFRPGVVVSWHGEWRSVPESYADALAAGAVGPVRWVLQFEDDVVLAPGFAGHAIRMLAEAYGNSRVGLVSFYSGRRVRPGEAMPAPPRLEYLPGARFLMAQAIAIRSELITDHNEFMIRWTAERQRPYGTDTATAAWLSACGFRYGRAWPSLVQHRDGPSVCRQRNTGRPHTSGPLRRSPSYTAAYGEIQ